MNKERQLEVEKYQRAYQNEKYALGKQRRQHITFHLQRIPKGTILDVSTGRGEVLKIAESLNFIEPRGTEAVDYLCDGKIVIQALVNNLPFDDNSFETVTMFDVMEHLLPEDTEIACKELIRVASKRVLITVHNGPSTFNGEDLHINRRTSYEAWHDELKKHFSREVIRHGMQNSISEMFEVLK